MSTEKVRTEDAFNQLVEARIVKLIEQGHLQEVRVASSPAPRLTGRFQTVVRNLFNWGERPKPGEGPPVWRKYADEVINDLYAQRLTPAWINLPSDRIALYDLYDEIANYDLVASILDAFSENATQPSKEHQKVVWVDTNNRKLRTSIEGLFDDIELEDMIVGMAYDLAKYGDDFCRLIYKDNKEGVYGLRWMDPRVVERVEDEEGVLIGFMPVEIASSLDTVDAIDEAQIWQPHDLVHFRIMKSKYHRMSDEATSGAGYGGSNAMYGTSLLRNVRRVAKQLRFLEELLIIFRLSRAIDKHIYYIDVGTDADPVSIQAKLNYWKKRLWRKDYQNPHTNEFDAIYDPQGLNEDIWWPVRGNDSASKVDIRQGIGNVGDIVDVDFFVSKLYAGLGVPKEFGGFEGGSPYEANKSLASQSSRFNRSVEMLQKSLINGLYRLVDIHLSLIGMNPNEFQGKYTLNMVQPSELEDLNRLDVFQLRVSNARDALDLGDQMQVDQVKWRLWIMREVLGFREPQIEDFYGKKPEENLDLPKAGESPAPAMPFGPMNGQPPPEGAQALPFGMGGQPQEDEEYMEEENRIRMQTLRSEMNRIVERAHLGAVHQPPRPKFSRIDIERSKAETRDAMLGFIKEVKDGAIEHGDDEG